jgi:protein-S-isoprenylcysteine O-methyltransferase Ste14
MDVFQIAALAIVTAFYGVYIGKQTALRRRGISGNRLARGEKPQSVRRLETALLIVTFTMPAVQYGSIVFDNPVLPVLAETPSFVQFAGAVVAFIGLLYFVMAVAAMRDSWRAGIDSSQTTEMVSTGIYRFSRNPAFVGFDLLYAGIAFMYPNVLTIALTVAGIALFHLQILSEEKYMAETFGTEYEKYRKRTLRY